MSEIGLNINVDSYNNEGIKTIKGNNNAEIYKLYILKNKIRLSLVGKTVKLGYVMAGTSKGDIIENLNITNAEQGEITFPITNRISKQDGVYSCQLAIYGADEFLEYTATFGLTVEDNIFTKIAGEIENSKDLTYIERILEEAKTVSGDLKTNIPVATNLNSSLESNISNARNINTTLSDTTEKSKVAATDAIEKKSQLESSITKAKEFIDGLDGSQNIPGIRMELTELQNGLKSNQALSYEGSSITANDTLEGRTEGMVVKGKTLNNLYKANNIREDAGGKYILVDTLVKDEPKDRVVYIVNNTNRILLLNVYKINGGWDSNPIIRENSISKLDLTGKKLTGFLGMYDRGWTNSEADKELLRNTCIVLDREETYIPQKYFEGLKSFGEAEKEGDKYKISILSRNKNMFDCKKLIDYGKDYNFNILDAENNIFTINNHQNTNIDLLDIMAINKKILPMSISFKTESIEGGISYFRAFYKDGTVEYIGNALGGYATYEISKDIDKLIFTYGSSGMTKFSNVQIEYGRNSSSYQAPQSDKKYIFIKEPLRGFDENTCDVMYEDNGQVKVNRQIGEYKITGDEVINRQSESAYTRFTIDNIPGANRTVGRHFIINSKVNFLAEGNKPMVGFLYNGSFFFYINNQNTDTVEMARDFIKGTTLCYQLATPVTEIVENCVDIDLDTYQEKTYFNILNSLPGTLDFKVPSNIGSVVQNMAKEVNNIWDVINNLLVPSIVKANGNLAMLKLNNNLN
ncbi:BppU family phage baseplate upper protein [Clostridium perfringens]|uniref:BppU family phage baseplate upper protein n=1 Tax=Clostridium perfringens TaxID=1502 RepID=UPI0024BC424E|nr:BppU family phage baseplate upper protein [Clostridium perfringens]MDM0627473.1 BppU family phage baseplate upper protein [Clostridium perfringens]